MNMNSYQLNALCANNAQSLAKLSVKVFERLKASSLGYHTK